MLYNFDLLTQTDFIQVPLVGAEQVAKKRFLSVRGLVVSLAILALTVSLANRTVYVSFYEKPAVHSHSSGTKIQHRDKDTSEWVFPLANLAVRCVIEPSIAPPSPERDFVALHYDSLYNRPPPIS